MLNKLFVGLILISSQANSIIDVNDSRIDKQALFYNAIRQGNIELVRLLIKTGVNVNHVINYDNYLNSTINNHTHIDEITNLEIIKLLLNAGANVNVNSNNHDGDVPLLLGIARGNIEVVKLLISAGANVNHGNDEYSTLMVATEYHNIETVRLLISAGANVNYRNKYGSSALFEALLSQYGVSSESIEISELLIDNGADVSNINSSICSPNHGQSSKTLFQVLSERGNFEVIEWLQRKFINC